MSPTPDQILTASLKLIVDEFVNMGYEERMIFGKVNLILQNFITAEGDFTEEYRRMAESALKQQDTAQIIVPGGISV
jgi:hypothetical protein